MSNMNFRLSRCGFDGRKKYTIKKVVKAKGYYGGYKIMFNETKATVSLGIFIDEFSTKTRRIKL